MNVRDVEETIHTLETRHPGLNEVMLLTLLKAGGWEEKDIETAKTLFRSSASGIESDKEDAPSKNLPIPLEEPVFEPVIDETHRLEAHVPDALAAQEFVSSADPISLVIPETPTKLPVREDIPHNLPLRPFETSEHIWPFSRYRDVFYGEEASAPTEPIDSSASYDVHHVQNAVLRTQVTENASPSREKRGLDTFHHSAERMHTQQEDESLSSVQTSGTGKKVVIVEKTGDEKLIIMTAVMLLAILLLLGYMYSNGRL